MGSEAQCSAARFQCLHAQGMSEANAPGIPPTAIASKTPLIYHLQTPAVGHQTEPSKGGRALIDVLHRVLIAFPSFSASVQCGHFSIPGRIQGSGRNDDERMMKQQQQQVMATQESCTALRC
ncbi:hypothetical protein B296_00001223 [Ensete ventricosum]|uniref:Uncharacterized protein n=1 Tax=Ensete ventricosum TaxID=4639 RepID=A0A427B5L5_ENSVE|nr:hypothetical protein B296_00001223 [Ensete ventricosum]